MLKINRKDKIPLIVGLLAIGGVLGVGYLTFVPEYSSAMVIDTPVYDGDKPKTLSNVVNMQDVTAEVCGASKVGETKRLRDKRDYTWYWVTKMDDGNCWMTQNLALDLDTNIWLTPDTSDVKEAWQPANTTLSGSVRGQWGDGKNRVQSWNPGEYVYTTPDTRYTCGTGLAGLYACKVDSWQDVSGWTASEDPEIASVIDVENKIYDAHYLSGNYYSYAAVTAGSGVGLATEDNVAENSICPKGWKLPLSGDRNNDKASYYRLMNTYGLIGSVNNGRYDVRLSPLYFVYSGYVDSSGLEHPGQRGDYLSSVPLSDTEAYFMSITNEVTPSNQNLRSYGMSARCVAYGSDDVKTPEIDNPNISVDVQPILTLSVSNKEVDLVPEVNGIATGEFIATVSSNAGYTLSLNAEEPDLVREDLTQRIPAISNEEDVVAGTRGWGIRTCANNNIEECNNKYIGLTTSLVPYAESASGVYNKETLFQVGVGIDSSLPSGTYGTTVTVTANMK